MSSGGRANLTCSSVITVSCTSENPSSASRPITAFTVASGVDAPAVTPTERAGQTDLTWDRLGHIRSAAITLAIRDPRGRLFTDQALRAVAVHELGHAIGLPHSAEPGDVMYPSTRTGIISRRDRATAMLLYQLTPGSLKDGGQ